MRRRRIEITKYTRKLVYTGDAVVSDPAVVDLEGSVAQSRSLVPPAAKPLAVWNFRQQVLGFLGLLRRPK